MTAIEKNAFFNSWSVKLSFLNGNRSRYYIYPGSVLPNEIDSIKSTRASSSDDIFDSYDVDFDRVETFGIEKSREIPEEIIHSSEENKPEDQPQNETIENVPEVISNETPEIAEHVSTATDSDSSDASLVIDTESPKKKVKKLDRALSPDTDSSGKSLQIDTGASPHPTKKKSATKKVKSPLKKSSVPAPTNLLNVILQDQEKMMQNNRKQSMKNKQSTAEQENPQDYVQPKQNQNVTYRTWNLRGNEKSIRLLVRSSSDAAVVSFIKIYNLFSSVRFK